MRNKQKLVTYAYHFLSEAIIIYMAAALFQIGLGQIWSYLLLVFIICMLFTTFSMRSNSYRLYISSMPAVFLGFYMLGYPLVWSILFSLLLTWRYINIRKEEIHHRQEPYLFITLLLIAMHVLFQKESPIYVYAILQFALLIFGHIFSLLSAVNKEQRKQVNVSFWLAIAGIFMVSIMTAAFLFEPLRYVLKGLWVFVSAIFVFIIRKIAVLFSFIPFDGFDFGGKWKIVTEMGKAESPELENHGLSVAEKWGAYIQWGLLFLLIGVILFLALRSFRNRFKKEETEYADAVVTYELQGPKRPYGKQRLREIGRKFLNKPRHPVRKLVYHLEHKLAKTKYRRHPYETMENWAKRTGMELNLETYQSVRYGEKDVSDEEIKAFQLQLKLLEKQLVKKD